MTLQTHLVELAGLVGLIMLIVSGAYNMGRLWTIVRNHSALHDGHTESLSVITARMDRIEREESVTRQEIAVIKTLLSEMNKKLDDIREHGCFRAEEHAPKKKA